MNVRRHPAPALLLAALLASFALAAPAGAVTGPAPGACNAYAPAPGCFYPAVSGTDTFTLSSHFVHAGQIITGTAKWEIGGQGRGSQPGFGAVTLDTYGRGLKLLGCKGPLKASNSAAAWNTPHAFDITKGHTTCRWRARSSTGWSTDLGLFVYASGRSYKAGDYYAVTGDTMLEGTIRFRNDRGAAPTSLGVPGSRVHITGPKGRSYNAATNADGYWYTKVDGGGTYKVTPIIPKKYLVGKDPVSPKKDTVKVKDGGVGKSKFLVDDPLKLTLSFDRTSVPATGATVDAAGVMSKQVVTATLTATSAGAPVPSFHVQVRPYQGRAMTLAQMPVLARICGGRLSWPTFNAADANNETSGYTDSSGKLTFSIIVGTIPGSLQIEARPLDTDGTTPQSTDLARVDPIETLKVTPMTGGDNVINGIKADIGKYGYLTGGTSWYLQLQRAAAAGELGGVNVAPVYGGAGYGAALVYPAGTRIGLSTTDNSLLNPTGVIVSPGLWAGVPGFPSDFETAARQGYVAKYPTIAEWLAGGKISWSTGGWNLGPVLTTPATAKSQDYQGYSFGFGYLGKGGC